MDRSADELADFMIEDGFDELRTDHKVVALLQLALGVDLAKTRKYGSDKHSARSNELTWRTVMKLLEFMDYDDESMRIYDAVFNTIDLISEENDFYYWFKAKARALESYLLMQKTLQDIAQEDRAFNPEPSASPEARLAVDDLFNNVLGVRAYGVKQAFTPARRGGSFIFEDPAVLKVTDVERNGSNDPSKGSASPVAVVYLTSQTEFNEKIEVKATEEKHGDIGRVIVPTINLQEGSIAIVLASNGELYTDHFSSHSIREIFELQEAGGAYEALRAEIIADFADLVMPAEIVMRAQTPKVERKYGVPIDEVIYELIAPRKRYMYEVTEEEVLIEDKKEQDEQNGDRVIRSHGVVWHTRRLLPGHNPSPQAIALAAEHNFVLPQGKTFVRSHSRGSGPKVIGHHFKGNA